MEKIRLPLLSKESIHCILGYDSKIESSNALGGSAFMEEGKALHHLLAAGSLKADYQ